MTAANSVNPSPGFIRFGLYPASWMAVLAANHLVVNELAGPRLVWGSVIGILAVTYLAVEFAWPYERRWSMTWRSLLDDLRYAAVNTAFVAGLSALLSLFAISISGNLIGPASNWPLPVQVVACLLIFEAINYALHRAMHEMPGAFGRFLWLTHAAHHLPPRLYLVMHAVFHPLNGMIIQGLAIILPVWLMGYDQKAVTIFLMINSMHGLISHFNVDIRMGWLNRIFVGPELHRYHHSADQSEAMNYGATLSVYDQLFGTFVYRPGEPPAELGVDERAGLPEYGKWFRVMALPFAR